MGRREGAPKILRREDEPNLVWLRCEYGGVEEMQKTGILVYAQVEGGAINCDKLAGDRSCLASKRNKLSCSRSTDLERCSAGVGF